MFTSIEPFPDLRDRVAEALGWTVEETKQFSLSTLRDLVRPISRKLTRELTLAKDRITVSEESPQVRSWAGLGRGYRCRRQG